MVGMLVEGLGKEEYNELAERLGVEEDSEEFIAAIKDVR